MKIRTNNAAGQSFDDQNPGYTIKMKDGHKFIYREGDHSLVIWGERMTGDLDFVVYASGIEKWEAPHDSELINIEKKAEILGRLDRYLKSFGISYELD